MKKVFSNSMVAHVWAQQNQSEGRSHNENFSFSGTVLYSYSTPIANFVRDKAGALCAFITCDDYSVTTSGHKSAAKRAVDYEYFKVPFLGVSGGRHRDGDDIHAGNMEYFLKQYRKELARAMRAQSAPYNYDYITGHVDAARDYAKRFGVKCPEIDTSADLAPIIARFEQLEAQRNDPKHIAKLERARAKREEKKEQERLMRSVEERERALKKLEEWNASFDDHLTNGGPLPFLSWDLRGYIDQSRLVQFNEREREIKERQERERELKALENVARWRNGEHVSISGLRKILLRVRGALIETSHGALFPLDHGKRAWPFIMKAKGTGWQRNGHAIHLGHFQIDEIRPNGDVKAGCHLVEFTEVERMARELGL